MATQAATFLEGLVFLLICFTGMRSRLIKIFPRTVLMAGACGIGAFIAFVGVKVIFQAVHPEQPAITSALSASMTVFRAHSFLAIGSLELCHCRIWVLL